MHLPYADGNANMATTYNGDGSKKVRKGNKKPIKLDEGFDKRIEDLQEMSEADYDKGIKIIKESSQGRRDRLRRMKNFHRDMFPPV